MAHWQVSRAFCYYMLQHTTIICDFDAVCWWVQGNWLNTGVSLKLLWWLFAAHGCMCC